MQKHLTTILLLTIITVSSCQKEITFNSNSSIDSTQLVTDSLKAIVFDGAYAGGTSISYDSAIISYGSQFTNIKHYSSPVTLMDTEMIGYDNSGRVISFRFADVTNTTSRNATFNYTGADSFPQQIRDTLLDQMTQYYKKYVFANPIATATGRRFSVYEDVQDLLNPTSSMDTTEVVLNAVSQLRSYTSSFLSSIYVYNTANNIDSSHAIKASGEESYFAATYSTVTNPLAHAIHRVYKNLLRFSVTDQLDNGDVETSLNICYLPSDLLSLKVPIQVRRGYYGSLTERLTYTYTIQNNLVKLIVINALDSSTGVTNTTRVRLYYR